MAYNFQLCIFSHFEKEINTHFLHNYLLVHSFLWIANCSATKGISQLKWTKGLLQITWPMCVKGVTIHSFAS